MAPHAFSFGGLQGYLGSAIVIIVPNNPKKKVVAIKRKAPATRRPAKRKRTR